MAQDSHNHVAIAPSSKGIESRSFGTIPQPSLSTAVVQARLDDEQQKPQSSTDHFFDLTQINLFAGESFAEPSAQPVTHPSSAPTVQPRESSSGQENEEKDEQSEQDEGHIQRKSLTSGDEDGNGNGEPNPSNGDAEDSEIPEKDIQAKLTIGQPGDKYEQEADSVAAQVVSTPDAAIQRRATETTPVNLSEDVESTTDCATPVIQTKEGTGAASTTFEQRLQQTKE